MTKYKKAKDLKKGDKIFVLLSREDEFLFKVDSFVVEKTAKQFDKETGKPCIVVKTTKQCHPYPFYGNYVSFHENSSVSDPVKILAVNEEFTHDRYFTTSEDECIDMLKKQLKELIKTKTEELAMLKELLKAPIGMQKDFLGLDR